MSNFRVAVVDGDTVFQWRSPLESLEDAQAKLPAAQEEYPDALVRVEQLVDTDVDEAGVVHAKAWTEVTE